MPDSAQPQLDHIWSRLSSQLRRSVGETTFKSWLSELRPHDISRDRIVISAPVERYDWVKRRFEPLLTEIAEGELGHDCSVELVAAGKEDAERATIKTEGFNPNYTFDQFVLGDRNRLAHAAALTVAELPGQAYNPLFIYGPPGQGKTHLLHSIANYIRAHDESLSVRYTTVEAFTNHFVSSLKTGVASDFKALYREVDVLLIDDIQFLESKARTEEEFFHTFNALYETGAQLVLTADRLPHDLSALEDRLRERFACGLVTQIEAPDYAMRVAILRKRAAQDAIELADESALEAIATHVTDSVRALEGALIRTVAYHSLTGRPLDGELAWEVMEGIYQRSRQQRSPTMEEIKCAICDVFSITPQELTSSSRSNRVSWPRQVAMYLARELTDETLPEIGKSFGGRSHTTVMHACKQTDRRISSDNRARGTVHNLITELKSPESDRRS